MLRRAARHTPQHGRWLIGPRPATTDLARYVGNTFVLETTHETDTGVVRVTDLMPVGDDRADLVRSVEGVSGTVVMRHEWIVRFGYGKIRPWVIAAHGQRRASLIITAIAGPDKLVLRGHPAPESTSTDATSTSSP